MSCTTLVTFFLNVPSCYSVHLFGSWDNFTHPYPMRKDTQKGHGNWVGCHSFPNVSGNGKPNPKSMRGLRGLAMGETYYYFYKLDNGIEYYNPAAPITSTCPALPGQPLNILEVPIEIPTRLGRKPSPDDQSTMNPNDRFRKLRDSLLRKDPSRAESSPVKDGQSHGVQSGNRQSDKLHASTSNSTTSPNRKRPTTTSSEDSWHMRDQSQGPDRVISSMVSSLGSPFRTVSPQDRPQTRKGDPFVTTAQMHDTSLEKHSSTPKISSRQIFGRKWHPQPIRQPKLPTTRGVTSKNPAINSPSVFHSQVQSYQNSTPRPQSIPSSHKHNHKSFSALETPPLMSMSNSPDLTPPWLTTPSESYPYNRELNPRDADSFNHTLDSDSMYDHLTSILTKNDHTQPSAPDDDLNLLHTMYSDSTLNDTTTLTNPFMTTTNKAHKRDHHHHHHPNQWDQGLCITGLDERQDFFKDVGYLGAVIA